MQAAQVSPEGPPTWRSRDRILHAAKLLFAERGYENTSTVAIARMAGTSESQLMKHFGSKEGLLEAILDEGWAGMARGAASLAGMDDPLRKLHALLEMVLRGFERDHELKELMLLEGRRVRKEGHMIMLTQGFLSFVRVIDSVLEELRDSGRLRTDVPPDAIRAALMGLLEGLMRDQLLAERMKFPASYNAKQLRRAFEMALASFLAPPATES
jgi:AcrR family transcriptional regulator